MVCETDELPGSWFATPCLKRFDRHEPLRGFRGKKCRRKTTITASATAGLTMIELVPELQQCKKKGYTYGTGAGSVILLLIVLLRAHAVLVGAWKHGNHLPFCFVVDILVHNQKTESTPKRFNIATTRREKKVHDTIHRKVRQFQSLSRCSTSWPAK